MRHKLPLGRWIAHRIRHRSRGQSLVELALILPVMMFLFAGAIDLGRVFYSQITIENAAKEGALEAARNPTSFDNTKPCDKDTNRVLCLVLNEAKGSMYEISAADVTLACSPSPCPTIPAVGDTVSVTVAGHFTLMTPILAQFVGSSVTLRASSVAQLGVTPDPGSAPTPTPSPSPTPSPAPTASPTPSPTASPTPTPVPTPTPTPTPTPPPCVTPAVTGAVGISPFSGTSVKSGSGTLFTMTAPAVTAQPANCTFLYTWSFGDGTSGSGTPATHTYANKGSGGSKDYTVTLVISTTGVPQTWTGTKNVVVNP